MIFFNQFKIDHGPNLRDKITKIQENMGENLYDLKLGKDFLNMMSKRWTTEKTMINKT